VIAIKILCFGDSNTYGYDPRSFFGGRYDAAHRWVDLLAETSGWEVVNAGANGREIPRGSGEVERFVQSMSVATLPDLLLVMLGGNDLLQGADALVAAARMEGFLKEIPLAKEQIVLIAPPPMQPGAWVTEERLLTDSVQLASAYAAVAGKLGIRFLDAGSWDIELTFDGVHFTETGHEVFAKELWRTLEQEFPHSFA